MGNKLKANGLELKTIKTRVEPLQFRSPLADFLSGIFKDDGYIIAYMDYKVIMGYFRNNQLILPDNESIEEKYLQRLRLFNDSKELYIWRCNNRFNGRLRIDGEGEDTEVVDASQVLWGTDSKSLGDFTMLMEERGTTLIVPVKDITIDIKKDRKNRLFLEARNYIGYTPIYQATYIDCRFMGFRGGK